MKRGSILVALLVVNSFSLSSVAEENNGIERNLSRLTATRDLLKFRLEGLAAASAASLEAARNLAQPVSEEMLQKHPLFSKLAEVARIELASAYYTNRTIAKEIDRLLNIKYRTSETQDNSALVRLEILASLSDIDVTKTQSSDRPGYLIAKLVSEIKSETPDDLAKMKSPLPNSVVDRAILVFFTELKKQLALGVTTPQQQSKAISAALEVLNYETGMDLKAEDFRRLPKNTNASELFKVVDTYLLEINHEGMHLTVRVSQREANRISNEALVHARLLQDLNSESATAEMLKATRANSPSFAKELSSILASNALETTVNSISTIERNVGDGSKYFDKVRWFVSNPNRKWFPGITFIGDSVVSALDRQSDSIYKAMKRIHKSLSEVSAIRSSINSQIQKLETDISMAKLIYDNLALLNKDSGVGAALSIAKKELTGLLTLRETASAGMYNLDTVMMRGFNAISRGDLQIKINEAKKRNIPVSEYYKKMQCNRIYGN